MPLKFIQFATVLLFLLSAYGWGRLGRHLLDRRIVVWHSLTAIFGLALLNVVGGLLNLVSLAYGWTLLLLLTVGVVYGSREILRQKPWQHFRFSRASIPVHIASGLSVGAAVLLIPAGIFNAHDDFQTYVTRPFRMVQTGSINGGPFDPLGVDSFGSQSFFHGFFLGDGSVGLLNGFDAIACFALCLLLSAELSLRWRLPWWLGTAAVLCLACFNPQYVNISPLYSGVAGVMAVTMAGAFLARAACAKTLFQLRPAAITFGLAVAWLATLKVTFNAYAAIFSCVLLLLILAGSHRRAAVIKAGMTSLLTAALCILPWMLIPLPGLFNAWHAGEIAGAAILHGDSGIAGSDLRLLFSPEGLYYGDTPLSYAMVAVLALVLGLAGLFYARLTSTVPKGHGLEAVVAAGLATMLVFLVHGHIFNIGAAIRYSCPVLMGGFFFVILAFSRAQSKTGTLVGLWSCRLAALVLLGTIVTFTGSFLRRLETAVRNRTLLAYPVDQRYEKFCLDTLADKEASYCWQVQTNLPVNAAALVWTSAPFHLDFTRNQLLVTSEAGLISPALHFPSGMSVAELACYLRGIGVEYVLMEVRGVVVRQYLDLKYLQESNDPVERKLGRYGAYFRGALAELAVRGTIYYYDGRTILFELPKVVQTVPAERIASSDPRIP